MWQLRQSFSKIEKIEQLLRNLEKLREEGSVDEVTYDRLREEYQRFLEENQAAIGKIKAQLTTNLAKREEELAKLQEDLRVLEARFKIGQLTEIDYQNRKQRGIRAVENTERKISELKSLISSSSAADVGGPVAVRIEPAKGIILPQLPEIKLAGLENIFTPLRVAGFVVGLLMLIFVFLPWVSVDWGGFASLSFKVLETVNTDPNSLQARDFNFGGIFALLAGILGIVVSLLANRSSSRGLGYFGAGILGLAGITIFSAIFANSYKNLIDVLEEQGLAGGLSFSPQVSGILYLIATLAILVIGYLELRQERK